MGNPNPSPATRFGGSRPPPHSSQNRNLLKLTRSNAEIAAEIRNRVLRGALTLLDANEIITEGRDAVDVAHAAVHMLPSSTQGHMDAADRAAGLHDNIAGESDNAPVASDRHLALALLETIRRGVIAAGEEDPMRDITPDDV